MKLWKLAIRAVWPAAVTALMLSGCGDDPPAQKKPPSKSPFSKAAAGLKVLTKGSAAAGNAPPAAAPTPPPAAAEGEGNGESDIAYAYSPVGKRDPFRSLFDEIGEDESDELKTELQQFELDQLRLVAVVSRIASPYAMVEDPDGKGHTLTRGTLIGKHWGRVSQIKPDCVVVKEEYPDYTGRKVTNKSSICLPKDGELKID